MDALYNQLISAKQKAVVGYIVVALVQYLTANGFELPEGTSDVIVALVVGIIGYVAVYLKRNKA